MHYTNNILENNLFSTKAWICHPNSKYAIRNSEYTTGPTKRQKNSTRDARTPQPGEMVFNTMRYRSSETVHRLGYLQNSVSVQIMFK